MPPDLVERLGQAKIHVVNFHKFLPRKTSDAGKLHQQIIEAGGTSVGVGHVETEAQVVRRLRRDLGLGTKRQIIVFNDEAHHCYRGRAAAKKERLTADERREAKERSKQAHIWLSGLQWVQRELGIKVVYDLSATPFFLRGSGYDEGTLFPWVVSDFSLIDAIESGIVKVPRVPVSDDAGTSEQPVYRNLWIQIRDELPKHGRKTGAVAGEPRLPERTGSGVAPALRQLRARPRALAAGRRRPRARVPARLHHRLQQHQRLEAGLRLRGRMGTAEPGWRGAVRPRRRPDAVQQRDRRPPQPPAQHDPDRQRRAGVRRPDERRLQAHRPQRDRRVQARLPSPLPGPRQRGYRGRGSAARGHEHRRQAGPSRRTREAASSPSRC